MAIKPYRTRGSELRPGWHVMDADGKTLGRLSTEIATLLQGKHKPIYVRHLNTGDYVVVVNAEKVRVTGKKLDQKVYYRHSGYPGGLKEETLRRVLDRTPTRAIRHAVKGMLPKNTVGRNMLSRLKLYVGDAHPHEAQVRGAQKAEERRLSAEADPAQEAEAETKPRTRARRRAVAPEAAPEAERTNEPSAQAEAIAEPPGQPAEAPRPLRSPPSRSTSSRAVAEPPEQPKSTSEQPAEAVAEPPEQPKSTSEQPAEAVAELPEQPKSTSEQPAEAVAEPPEQPKSTSEQSRPRPLRSNSRSRPPKSRPRPSQSPPNSRSRPWKSPPALSRKRPERTQSLPIRRRLSKSQRRPS